jgi:hypothetical protein
VDQRQAAGGAKHALVDNLSHHISKIFGDNSWQLKFGISYFFN